MEVDRLEVIIEAEAKKANAELDRLIGKLNQVSSALGKATGFNLGSGTSSIRNTTNSLNNYTKATTNAVRGTHSLTSQLSRLAVTFFTVRRAILGIGNAIEKSMDYGETINLFQTTFKKIGMETASENGMAWGSESADAFARGFIDRAQNFNDMLTDALSLDPNMMMNYQAVFAQMTNSMGLVAESSINMSEAFTMLGTDIASLWNMDIDKSMKKLQGGLAGQIRPLRELGFDISQTSLEMTALNYGIEDSVKDMSQAAKVQLRWLSIMDQAEVAFGDMAKTINSPANQLRILRQQWVNLTRSIGNVFLPVVTTILPYINALVIALRRMIDTLATAVGFELPDYTDTNIYSSAIEDIEGVYSDLGGTIDDTTKANEKLKKSIAGFDELNILSENRGTKSKGIGGIGSGYDELDDTIKDKTASYMAKFNEELQNMSNKANELADKLQPKLEKLVEWLDKISPALKGISAAFITYKVITWFADLATKIGTLSTSPAGVIALAIGGIVMLYSAIKEYNEKLVKEDLEGRFGKISLSMEDIEKIAKRLTDSEYSANIEIYVTEKAKLSEIEKNIEEDLKKLNKLNWKISIGMELTEGEKEEYKSSIESFIKNSQDYIEQQQYVVSLALSATITDDSAFLKEMQTLTNEYFNGSKAEMESLGKKLRNTMDKAFADGKLDASEQELIMNIQKEMFEVTKRLADAESKAKMQILTLEYEGVDITQESFEKLTEDVQGITQERLDKINEASYSVLTTINQAYTVKMKNATTQAEKNKIQKEWDDAVNEYTQEFSKTKSTITLDGITFSIDSLSQKYKTELEKTGPIVQQSVKDAIENGMYWGFQDISQDKDGALKDAYELPFERLTSDLAKFYEKQLTKELPDATRKGAKEMFETLSPTNDELKKIFDDALKAGTQVPDGITKALTDTANIGAIADDLESINFLIGQMLSTDPTFLEALRKGEIAGKDVDDAILRGLKSKLPDLKLQGEKLILETEKGIKEKTIGSNKIDMPKYANGLIKDFNSTFTNDTTVLGHVQTWLDKISTKVSNFKLPNLTIGFNADTSSIDNIFETYRSGNLLSGGKIRKYANGGMPEPGEIFQARENGIPELVGSVGRKTAVMNNNQIVDSVSSGVADAVARTIVPFLSGSSGGSGDIVVENYWYAGDEKLYQATQRGRLKSERRFQTVNEF